ncbi:MAG: DUF6089 family protein [Bacteroidota bacterium]|nr:DUF6089 family protein [Bacteroidota bacterium]
MFLHFIILLLLWEKTAYRKYDFNYLRRCPGYLTLAKYLKPISLLLFIFFHSPVFAQEEEFSKEPSVVIYTGLINYQGDLNPNSFTIGHANFATGISLRKPVNRWFTARAGITIGQIEAADRYNRDYLKPRNLSFFSNIKEAFAALEFTFLDINRSRFTPYVYAGIAVFHFNPWTYDNEGQKVYLQPLSTEGEGIPQFPSQKPYHLTQFSLPFGIGAKYAISNNINIGFEFSQRKTFTDYLDDVSSFYVDKNVLLQARGPKAVELAYRGNELPGGTGYPAHGEQRGTASEMDWYYFAGLNIEIKLSAFTDLFNGSRNNKSYQQRCPRKLL